MATIKSFTSLEQSRKLAEILPLESSDMHYHYDFDFDKLESIPTITEEDDHFELFPEDICAWSLAALLGVLPMITEGKDTANPFIAKTPDNEYYIVYATLTKEVNSSGIFDNPVDACYDMIIHLNKLKML